MNKIFSALDHYRFEKWWKQKHPSVPLFYPVAAAKITIKDSRFDFNHEGKDAIILPVGREYDGGAGYPVVIEEIDELVAWLPAAPDKLYFYTGRKGMTLGNLALNSAHVYGSRLTVRPTPLAWLEAACDGCVPMDGEAIDDLRGLKEIECPEPTGLRITERLQRMPKIIIKGIVLGMLLAGPARADDEVGKSVSITINATIVDSVDVHGTPEQREFVKE